jgi:anthranilate/para-aminobenzoate synthase component II
MQMIRLSYDIADAFGAISAMADDGTIIAVRHKKFLVEGVQFHPESIKMKPYGIQILKNFLEYYDEHRYLKNKNY